MQQRVAEGWQCIRVNHGVEAAWPEGAIVDRFSIDFVCFATVLRRNWVHFRSIYPVLQQVARIHLVGGELK